MKLKIEIHHSVSLINLKVFYPEIDELKVENILKKKKKKKKLKSMRPKNYIEALKCLPDVQSIFDKLNIAHYEISESEKVLFMYDILPKILQITFLPNPNT